MTETVAPEIDVAVRNPAKLDRSHDDIWGSYLADWSKPRASGGYSAAADKAKAWKPAAFQAFDVSKYLLRGREGKAGYGAAGRTGTGAGHWWEASTQPASPDAPWWETLAADMPEDAPATPEPGRHAPAHRRGPAYRPYVPRAGNNYRSPFTQTVHF